MSWIFKRQIVYQMKKGGTAWAGRRNSVHKDTHVWNEIVRVRCYPNMGFVLSEILLGLELGDLELSYFLVKHTSLYFTDFYLCEWNIFFSFLFLTGVTSIEKRLLFKNFFSKTPTTIPDLIIFWLEFLEFCRKAIISGEKWKYIPPNIYKNYVLFLKCCIWQTLQNNVNNDDSSHASFCSWF